MEDERYLEIETDEHILCPKCKEHAGIVEVHDRVLGEMERQSNCCGAHISDGYYPEGMTTYED